MNTGDIRFPGQPVAPAKPGSQPVQKKTPDVSPFSQVWQETLQKQSGVKFSAHALQRLQDRRIELGQGELVKINEAVSAADKKGSRSSLLLYDDLALVASVKNRTIITAMGGDDMREHVFTNIDSAVIIK
ncbi:TIGR02530 family flagellar biosynthesis protein [Dethiobacter alkaliphilus]|uniref:TIGR02530 family flagellar biosynthesis protein n=1 Tax=Dethiobacter alkaliphilus TaxID=427926 RepID=UPI002226F02F|nr:TIGR02530 family flagellar biosynthesis protein [Dethiobacter alkaliphilus]MCW3488741.1 flagellar biosynthesis protein [Dethiobacter alkaliphilus]